MLPIRQQLKNMKIRNLFRSRNSQLKFGLMLRKVICITLEIKQKFHRITTIISPCFYSANYSIIQSFSRDFCRRLSMHFSWNYFFFRNLSAEFFKNTSEKSSRIFFKDSSRIFSFKFLDNFFKGILPMVSPGSSLEIHPGISSRISLGFLRTSSRDSFNSTF